MRVTVFLTLFLVFCSLDVSAKRYRVTTSAYADVSIRITNSAYADHSICLRQDQDQEKIIAAIYVLEFLDR